MDRNKTSNPKDPRVLFAAERTLLAWNRTSLSFMAFGFLIERFELFVHTKSPALESFFQKDLPFWIGIAFILLGVVVAFTSLLQYRKIFRTLKTEEVSEQFNLSTGLLANAITAVFGMGLVVYLFATTF